MPVRFTHARAFLLDARPFAALALSALALCGGGGCKVDKLFHADFQADAVNSDPNTSPPTDPPDDLIWYGSPSNELKVINSSVADSKALQITDGSDWGIPVGFVGIEPPRPSTEYYAFWTGYAPDDDGPPLTIAFSSGHFQSGVELTLKDGQFHENVFHSETSGSSDIGDYDGNQFHAVLIKVNKLSNTYDLTILRSGTSNIVRTNRPITNPDFWDSDRFAIYVFTETNPGEEAGDAAYVIDNPIINQKEPLVYMGPWREIYIAEHRRKLP